MKSPLQGSSLRPEGTPPFQFIVISHFHPRAIAFSSHSRNNFSYQIPPQRLAKVTLSTSSAAAAAGGAPAQAGRKTYAAARTLFFAAFALILSAYVWVYITI
jgi:hypothetical protein